VDAEIILMLNLTLYLDMNYEGRAIRCLSKEKDTFLKLFCEKNYS